MLFFPLPAPADDGVSVVRLRLRFAESRMDSMADLGIQESTIVASFQTPAVSAARTMMKIGQKLDFCSWFPIWDSSWTYLTGTRRSVPI